MNDALGDAPDVLAFALSERAKGWQPIDTVPRDGVPMLVWGIWQEHAVPAVCWHNGNNLMAARLLSQAGHRLIGCRYRRRQND